MLYAGTAEHRQAGASKGGSGAHEHHVFLPLRQGTTLMDPRASRLEQVCGMQTIRPRSEVDHCD